MGKFKIIPIFVPHKGCPNQCSFCNQKHITGQLLETTPKMAEDIIKKYLTTIDTDRFHTEIAFYGGSFTAIDIDYQTSLLKIAYKYVQTGQIKGIRLSTRPDAIDYEILDNLKKYGVTEIELGVQSMCEDVLELNKRGHSAEHVKDAVSKIREYGFSLGLQMMVGLIGDTYEKSIYTANEICKLKPDFVRIYPTLVFNNTDLADMYYRGEYKPLSTDEAVIICKELLDLFEKRNGIKVIRLGLLMNETEAKENFIAGPYHPRFRELVNDCV
jgi:histone acetyltransferase (RNA polymerase elongator complex component)